MEGGWKILNEMFAGVPVVNAKLKQRFVSVTGVVNKVEQTCDEKLSPFCSAFIPGAGACFCSSCCNFFIIWHLPLHANDGLALFSQFFAYTALLK